MTKTRIYFFDAKMNELSDHPLNGCGWDGSGSCISTEGEDMDKAPIGSKKYESRSGHLVTRQFWGCRRGQGSFKITIQDFPGHDQVYVKVWTPGELRYSEVRLMVAESLIDRLRKKSEKIS